VKPGGRVEPEQLARREHVERDLDVAALRPARAGIRAPALVVAHYRLAAGADVDAVDAPRHRQVAECERPVRVALAAELPLEVGRLQPRAVLGLVAEVALKVGLQRPAGGRAARALE